MREYDRVKYRGVEFENIHSNMSPYWLQLTYKRDHTFYASGNTHLNQSVCTQAGTFPHAINFSVGSNPHVETCKVRQCSQPHAPREFSR